MFRLSLLIVFFGLSSLVVAQDAGKTQARIQKRTYEFKDAAKDMEYALFVHSKYDKDAKTPLMVALHGLGGNPQQIMRYKGLTDLAEKHGFIVVAPMGYNPSGWYGNTNPLKKKNDPPNLGELSEKDVMNVLAIARKEFTIDENRIYLMGHSMGGIGTWAIAPKYPDIWAAIAPLSGIGSPETAERIRHIPEIIVHGDADPTVDVASSRVMVEKLKALGVEIKYIEVPGGLHSDVVAPNLPAVIEFFNTHKKGAKTTSPQ